MATEVDMPQYNLFRERERVGYGFDPSSRRGIQYDADAGGNDKPQEGSSSAPKPGGFRSYREEMIEHLIVERKKKEEEIKLERQRERHSSNFQWQEKKRSTYMYVPDEGIKFDDRIDNPIIDLKNVGNDAFKEGEYGEAIKCYEKGLAMSPPPELASVLLGNISLVHLRTGKLHDALDAADAAVAAYEKRARNHVRRSRALHALGQFKAALDALWKAQELAPYDLSVEEAVREERKFVFTMTRILSEDQAAAVAPLAEEEVHYTTVSGSPLPPELGGEGRDMLDWVSKIGDGATLILSARVDRGDGNDMQGFIYVASREDWALLEEPHRMGPKRARGKGLQLGNAAEAAGIKLRDELGKLPWADCFKGEPRMVREFQPLAVALLLGRHDWLLKDELAFLEKCGLMAAVEMHRREGFLAAKTTSAAAGWVGLVPLLKACLYCPYNSEATRGILGGRQGDVDGLEAALFEGKGGGHVACVVYDRARAWIEGNAPGAQALLELATCMLVQKQPLKLFLQVVSTGMTVSVAERVEEGVYVTFLAKAKAKEKKKGAAEGPQAGSREAWKAPKSWKCFMTERGVAAAVSMQEKGPTYAAVECGDAATVSALMRSFRAVQGPDAVFDESEEARLAGNACLLHLAAQLGFRDVCSALVAEGGYDVDSRSEDGMSPMMLAAQAGHFDVVEFLLSQRGNYIAQAKNGSTALHEAVLGGHEEIVRLLMAQGNAKFLWAVVGRGGTPLQLAVLMGHQAIVKFLLDAGCRVPEGPPPASFLKMVKGPMKVARVSWLEAFYIVVVLFLPSVQADQHRIFDTFVCLRMFMKYHKPPVSNELNARLSEGEWDMFFPPAERRLDSLSSEEGAKEEEEEEEEEKKSKQKGARRKVANKVGKGSKEHAKEGRDGEGEDAGGERLDRVHSDAEHVGKEGSPRPQGVPVKARAAGGKEVAANVRVEQAAEAAGVKVAKGKSPRKQGTSPQADGKSPRLTGKSPRVLSEDKSPRVQGSSTRVEAGKSTRKAVETRMSGV